MGSSIEFTLDDGSKSYPGGTILAGTDPLTTPGAFDGGLLFYTTAGGSATEKQKLTFGIGNDDQRAYFSGNVGIKTASPAEALDVIGSIQSSVSVITDAVIGGSVSVLPPTTFSIFDVDAQELKFESTKGANVSSYSNSTYGE